MKLELKPGKYVLAVSGGVDSVVLLHLLAQQNQIKKERLKRKEADKSFNFQLSTFNLTNLRFVVAHFDHGIRQDSATDRQFVEKLAQNYGLEFFYSEGKLGSDSSEAMAREKRYEFLEKIKAETGADAIVTAHHQDDLLETVVINLMRGTGRKGLSSLGSRPGLIRPLLEFSKDEIVDYAETNHLQWREDQSNQDQKYLRNFVRLSLLPKLPAGQKKELLTIARQSALRNQEIDRLVKDLFVAENGISRGWFVSLSHGVAAEIVVEWLRSEDARIDKAAVERLVISLKTAPAGKIIQASHRKYFVIKEGTIRMNTVRTV